MYNARQTMKKAKKANATKNSEAGYKKKEIQRNANKLFEGLSRFKLFCFENLSG
jgi:hypothetical protein